MKFCIRVKNWLRTSFDRCCSVWLGVHKVARGAPAADMRAKGGSAGAFTRKRAQDLRRQLLGPLWHRYQPQDYGGQNRRLSPCFRHLEDSCWALLHVDWRFPAFRAHQGTKCIFIIAFVNLGKNRTLVEKYCFIAMITVLYIMCSFFWGRGGTFLLGVVQELPGIYATWIG